MLFQPRHDFLVALDSDGCVFDSMEVKQVEHFHPLILQHWRLEPVEKPVRAIAEYVNLRSPWRGSNRFVALLKTFELFHQSPAIRAAHVTLPALEPLRDWVESGGILSNDRLADAADDDPALMDVLKWSLAVNADISARMKPVPPFEGVRDALAALQGKADLVVVSLTPLEALEHEWDLHGLRDQVHAIAGQERGTKTEQLQLAMQKKAYRPDQVLLVGDAPGDLKAAREAGVCFAPTIPGEEAASWQRLLDEDLGRFFDGTYRDTVMEDRVRAFQDVLSAPPPLEEV